MTPQLSNVLYRPGTVDAYELERCRLDYFASGQEAGPILVWFHGGGLTGGDRQEAWPLARHLSAHGVAVGSCGYRLSPRVHYPAYIQDARAALLWARGHGGPGRPLFVGGHSAGAYLAAMVALQPCGETPRLCGVVAMSGQMLTHFTVRTERGLPAQQALADEAAPLYHAHSARVPFCLLVAEHDMAARREENMLMAALLSQANQAGSEYHCIPGRDHCTIGERFGETEDPAAPLVLEFLNRHAKARIA